MFFLPKAAAELLSSGTADVSSEEATKYVYQSMQFILAIPIIATQRAELVNVIKTLLSHGLYLIDGSLYFKIDPPKDCVTKFTQHFPSIRFKIAQKESPHSDFISITIVDVIEKVAEGALKKAEINQDSLMMMISG